MTTQENIDSLKDYLRYTKKKKCPRNQETQEAIKDCIKILQDKFEEIRARDIQYEQRRR